VHAYAIAILAVYGLSSFSLAFDLHRRLGLRRLSVFHLHCAILLLTAAWGAATLGGGGLLPGSSWRWLASLPLGVVAGEAALRCDRSVVRLGARRLRPVARRPGLPQAARIGTPTIVAGRLGSRGARRKLGAHRLAADSHLGRDSAAMSKGLVAAVAVLEELVFRGFLFFACLRLSGVGAPAAVVALVGAFALTHVWFGWIQVAAKLPLGLLATLCVLVAGVLPAVLAHVVFNLRVTARLREVG
jgi:hypothetical protein